MGVACNSAMGCGLPAGGSKCSMDCYQEAANLKTLRMVLYEFKMVFPHITNNVLFVRVISRFHLWAESSIFYVFGM